MKLTIELVPSTAWFSNVRSCVSKEDWDILRKNCYRNAKYVCEICKGRGDKWPVECHEIWEYDDKNHIQTLIRMISLCPSCHEVKHIGFAKLQGREMEALEHLMKVNKINKSTAKEYVYKSFLKWQERSEYEWELDLTFLDNHNIQYTKDRNAKP